MCTGSRLQTAKSACAYGVRLVRDLLRTWQVYDHVCFVSSRVGWLWINDILNEYPRCGAHGEMGVANYM